MPWSQKQMSALRAKQHGATLRSGLFAGVSAEKAGMMADEGGLVARVKHASLRSRVRRALKRGKKNA
jgi:hypothetical protein